MLSFHVTLSRIPVASHLAIIGLSASLSFGTFSHKEWMQRNVY